MANPQWQNVTVGGADAVASLARSGATGMSKAMEGAENLVREQQRVAANVKARKQEDNSVAALEALLTASSDELGDFSVDEFGDMTAEQRSSLLQAHDKRAGQLVAQEAAIAENELRSHDAGVTSAVNEYWEAHGGQIADYLQNGDKEAAYDLLEQTLTGDGNVDTKLRDRFLKREKAIDEHNTHLENSELSSARAKQSLARVKEAKNNESLQRELFQLANDAGPAQAAAVRAAQSQARQVGMELNVLDDEGRVLGNADPEAIAQYMEVISELEEEVTVAGQESINELREQARRISDPQRRERVLQDIESAYTATLGLGREQERELIAEAADLKAAVDSQRLEIEEHHQELIKENIFYEALSDERTTNERLSALNDILDAADNNTDFGHRGREYLADLVTRGIDVTVDGKQTPVKLTPELLETFIKGKGARERGWWELFRREPTKANDQLKSWLTAPERVDQLVAGNRAHIEIQERRDLLEQQLQQGENDLARRRVELGGRALGQSFGQTRNQLEAVLAEQNRNTGESALHQVRQQAANESEGNRSTSPDLINQIAEQHGITLNEESRDAVFDELEYVENNIKMSAAYEANQVANETRETLRSIESMEGRLQTVVDKRNTLNTIQELESQLEEVPRMTQESFKLRDKLAQLQQYEAKNRGNWRGVPTTERAIDALAGSINERQSRVDELQQRLTSLSR